MVSLFQTSFHFHLNQVLFIAYSSDPAESIKHLVHLNLIQGYKVLKENPIVKKSLGENSIKIHTWIYDVATGLINNLNHGE